MKGRILLTVAGFVATGAVATFGAISLLKDPNIITPDKFAVESASLHVQVDASVDWASTNNTFRTETSSEGFMQDDWDMPGLELSENLNTATLTIQIANLSNTATEIAISGIGYDSAVIDTANYRFRTVVEEWEVGAQAASNSVDINGNTPTSSTYRLASLASGETIILRVVYTLVATNIAFEVENDITMSFNIVTPGE